MRPARRRAIVTLLVYCGVGALVLGVLAGSGIFFPPTTWATVGGAVARGLDGPCHLSPSCRFLDVGVCALRTPDGRAVAKQEGAAMRKHCCDDNCPTEDGNQCSETH